MSAGTRTVSVTFKTSGSQTVTASDITDGTKTANTSPEITVNAASASRLIVQTQPSPTATAGVPFAQQPVIRIEDAYGNLRADDNSTVVTVARSAGSGTLQGTLTATAVNGVVTFTNLSHNLATTITLNFTASGLTGATSGNIVVGPGYRNVDLGLFREVLDPGETAFLQLHAGGLMRAYGYVPEPLDRTARQSLRFATADWPGQVARMAAWHAVFRTERLRALMRDVGWGFFYGTVNFDSVIGTVNHYGSVDLFAGRFNEHYRRAKLDHTERFTTPLIQRVFEAMLEDWTNAGFDPFASPQETGSAFGPKRVTVSRTDSAASSSEATSALIAAMRPPAATTSATTADASAPCS